MMTAITSRWVAFPEIKIKQVFWLDDFRLLDSIV